jgi:hypothetical protein
MSEKGAGSVQLTAIPVKDQEQVFFLKGETPLKFMVLSYGKMHQ